ESAAPMRHQPKARPPVKSRSARPHSWAVSGGFDEPQGGPAWPASARGPAEAMMLRTVGRHRPQSEPAPHMVATCLDVDAPLSTAVITSRLVTPKHRHTNISGLNAPGEPDGAALRHCAKASDVLDFASYPPRTVRPSSTMSSTPGWCVMPC